MVPPFPSMLPTGWPTALHDLVIPCAYVKRWLYLWCMDGTTW